MLNGGPAARRALPSIDRLLNDSRVEPLIGRYGRSHVTDTLRALLDSERQRLSSEAANGFDDHAFLNACASRLEKETAL